MEAVAKPMTLQSFIRTPHFGLLEQINFLKLMVEAMGVPLKTENEE